MEEDPSRLLAFSVCQFVELSNSASEAVLFWLSSRTKSAHQVARETYCD
jgi:hypothetical protein